MSRAQRGMTMMEVVVSILLVGIVLSAALSTVGGARVARAQTADLAISDVLSESLMNEILSKAYEGADEGAGSFGRSGTESGASSRASFDDVDDFDGWTSTPPQDVWGFKIDWADGLTRTVDVVCVRSSDYAEVSPDGQSLKQITVQVLRGDRLLSELVAYRSSIWPDPEEVSP